MSVADRSLLERDCIYNVCRTTKATTAAADSWLMLEQRSARREPRQKRWGGRGATRLAADVYFRAEQVIAALVERRAFLTRTHYLTNAQMFIFRRAFSPGRTVRDHRLIDALVPIDRPAHCVLNRRPPAGSVPPGRACRTARSPPAPTLPRARAPSRRRAPVCPPPRPGTPRRTGAGTPSRP